MISHQIIMAGLYLRRAESTASSRRQERNTAQNALNVCLAHAYRTCGCVVHHTESVTSCSCSYNTWNGWCHCPAN